MEGDYWILAFRYPDLEAAGPAYEQSRDFIFAEELDASAFRVTLNEAALVIVVGDGNLPDHLREHFYSICSQGDPAELPLFIGEALLQRSREARGLGFSWERRRQ